MTIIEEVTKGGLVYFEAVSKHQIGVYFIKWSPISFNEMKTGSYFFQNSQVKPVHQFNGLMTGINPTSIDGCHASIAIL